MKIMTQPPQAFRPRLQLDRQPPAGPPDNYVPDSDRGFRFLSTIFSSAMGCTVFGAAALLTTGGQTAPALLASIVGAGVGSAIGLVIPRPTLGPGC